MDDETKTAIGGILGRLQAGDTGKGRRISHYEEKEVHGVLMQVAVYAERGSRPKTYGKLRGKQTADSRITEHMSANDIEETVRKLKEKAAEEKRKLEVGTGSILDRLKF